MNTNELSALKNESTSGAMYDRLRFLRNHVDLSTIDDSEIRGLVAEYVPSLREDGTIGEPGKFQGEYLWTVYYWGWMLQGEGESTYEDCEHTTMDDETWDGSCDCESEIAYDSFTVDGSDVEAFPGLDTYHGREIRVRTDSQGFVYSWLPETDPNPFA